jgi:hypothetical protein
MTARRRAAADDLARAVEEAKAEAKRADAAAKAQAAQLGGAARDLQDVEDALRQWRADAAAAEAEAARAQAALALLQREEKEARAAAAARQVGALRRRLSSRASRFVDFCRIDIGVDLEQAAADEELQQTQRRTQLAAAALRELATQVPYRTVLCSRPLVNAPNLTRSCRPSLWLCVQVERRKADADGCRAAWRAAEARRDEALSAVQQHEGALEGLKDAAAGAAREAARARDEATRWRAEAEAAATKAAAAKAALLADEQARDIAQRDVQVPSLRPSFSHHRPGLPLNLPLGPACVQRAREEVAALRTSEEALAAATAEATRALDAARIDLQQQRAAAERERRTAAEARAIRCVRTTSPGPPSLSCLSL